MRTNLVSGQFQLRTSFSRPERVRLRELPLYSFTHLIKKSNLFSFFFNKQWFICPLPEPQRSVMWTSYLKKPLRLSKTRQESYFLELNTSFAQLSTFLLFSVITEITNKWRQPYDGPASHPGSVLRGNPPGNWVILIFSGPKPWTRII